MPININYEPSPFLQVASSWWGQRRLMAHQVAAQKAQHDLQQQQVSQQGFSQLAGIGLQAAGMYQQARQFDASLGQQQQLATQGMDHAFEMVDFKNFGMREVEMRAAMGADVAAGTIAPETTIPQYRRRLETERLKLTQDTATQQAIQQHWINKTGQSPQQLRVAAQGAGFDTNWQEYGLTVGRQQRIQEQMQLAQAQAMQQQQAADVGDAERRLMAAGRVNEVNAYDSAFANLQAAQQGHGKIPLPQAQQAFDEAKRDMLLARRTLEADPVALQDNFKAHVLSTPIVNPMTGELIAIATSVPKPPDTQVSITTPDGDGAGAGMMNPVYKWADDVARKSLAWNEELDDMAVLTDEAEIGKKREKIMQGYELYRQSQQGQQGLVQMPELAQLLGQYGQKQDEQQVPAQQRAMAEEAMAEQAIAQLRRKQEAGQPLTAQERQAFEQAYNYLHPQQTKTPQQAPAQDPAVDEARNVIRQLLTKRQAGEQLTQEERKAWQAARDVLARATQ